VLIGELSGLASALFWACNSVLLRWLAPRADVIALNAVRCLIAAVLLLGALALQGRLRALLAVPWEPGVLLVASVLIGVGLGDSLYFHALRLVGVAQAQPLSMSYPLITAVLAMVLLGEALTLATLGGILLVVLGVYGVATAHSRLRRGAGGLSALRSGRLAGLALSLGAAGCWACSTILLRPALASVDVWVATAVRLIAAALVLTLYAAPRVPRVGRVAWRQPAFTFGVLGLGVGTALAIALFVTSVLYAGAARAAALSSTSPLFGVPIAAILLKEPLTLRLICGVGLIVAGVWLILAR